MEHGLPKCDCKVSRKARAPDVITDIERDRLITKANLSKQMYVVPPQVAEWRDSTPETVVEFRSVYSYRQSIRVHESHFQKLSM